MRDEARSSETDADGQIEASLLATSAPPLGGRSRARIALLQLWHGLLPPDFGGA
jgi:hypothetical protein